ncbi:hypothetical protein LN042_19615 [Kitasatospora sp. RB6PN24]|uniref:hypothetical protein n=1 Tax=Kitasatospora humi TaxID=2893891 RepID=UPI001E411EE0|nr:hypothetical protein [Kitasatospora humi]MCC9309266.1 hypothetical protein [Kitasatospora humi]
MTDWAKRYFGLSWTATPGADDTGPLITATDNPIGNAIEAPESAELTDEAVFARERIHYSRHPDGTVTARTQTAPVLQYRYTPANHHLAVTSSSRLALTAIPDRPTRLATAVTRFTRELMRAQLIADGWVLLHASATVLANGTALLAVGDSGAGKTTTALTLAANGCALLANDCCFARLNTAGELDLLPWPSAAAIGLGLLEALGWSSIAGAHLADGESPHPTQHPQVTDALITERTAPMRTQTGRELKAHIWPEQLSRWFHLTQATTATATAVLLPRIDPTADPVPRINTERCTEITPSVFVTSDGAERYPDLFGLTDGSTREHSTARAAVIAHLNTLPRYAVDLGHDHAANTDILRALASRFAQRPGGRIPALE